MNNKYEVLWVNIAENDLKRIINYIANHDLANARTILKRIRERASNLNHLPERGRIVPELREHGILQYRELIVPPWRIIYRITEGNAVYVLAVIDSRQNIEDILFNRLTMQ